jgi:hypothetical protein
MSNCAICDGRMEAPGLVDSETGSGFHPACVAARLPEDLIALAIASVALVLVPTIVVWAG